MVARPKREIASGFRGSDHLSAIWGHMRMRIRWFVLVLALAFAATSSVAAYPLHSIGAYQVGVGLQHARRGSAGDISPNEITFLVRAAQAARSVRIYATIEARSGNRWMMMGSLGCNVGDLAAGESRTVAGVSCDSAPTIMRLPSNAEFRAALNIVDANGRTSVGHTDILNRPPVSTVLTLSGIDFDATVLLETRALPPAGRSGGWVIRPEDIAVFVRAREHASDVSVYASLEASSGQGPSLALGSIGCHVGPLQAGQGTVYHGNSCDAPSADIVLPAHMNLLATISVRHSDGQTESRQIQVQEVRVGMPYRNSPP